MNENKSNEEKWLKDKEFENMWEYQQGSLMLKNENSSLDWKKSIARYFYDFGRKSPEAEIEKLKDLVAEVLNRVNDISERVILPEEWIKKAKEALGE